VRIQEPQHVKTLLNVLNQIEMQENSAKESAEKNLQIWRVNLEMLIINNDMLEYHSNQQQFN